MWPLLFFAVLLLRFGLLDFELFKAAFDAIGQ